MRIHSVPSLFLFALPLTFAQGTVPTFERSVGRAKYVLLGEDPAQGRVTTVPTVLVPVTLSFEAKKVAGKPYMMDATSDIPRVLSSPIFSHFNFPSGGTTQYADAM